MTAPSPRSTPNITTRGGLIRVSTEIYIRVRVTPIRVRVRVGVRFRLCQGHGRSSDGVQINNGARDRDTFGAGVRVVIRF